MTDKYMTKAILFDLDGVLVDSYAAWFIFFNQALRHFGFPEISMDIFQKYWGQSTEDDVRIFLPGRTVDEVRRYFLDHIGDFIDQVKVDPQALKVLNDLIDRGYKLGCITNSHREIVEAVLGRNGLERFLKVILTADDLQPKPAPDMILEACTLLEVMPADTVFIGDTLTDLQAAEAAGCIFIGYRLETENNIHELNDILLTNKILNI